MAVPPPPLPSPTAVFSGSFLIIVSTVVLLIIAVTLLLNSCRCLLMATLVRCFSSCRMKKEPRAEGRIPVCRYREEQTFSTECSVCLTAFQEGEKVKKLPACRHSFHPPCVDMWLYSHSSCPSCRAPVPWASSRAAALENSGQIPAEMAVAVGSAV